MTNLINFQNTELGQVKILEKNGEPWFVARDICDILELNNLSKALSGLDNDEIVTEKMKWSDNKIRHIKFINESGLYSLILRSRKPEAKKFKKWVTSEVLPAIRKTGSYTHQNMSIRGYKGYIGRQNKEIARLKAQLNSEVSGKLDLVKKLQTLEQKKLEEFNIQHRLIETGLIIKKQHTSLVKILKSLKTICNEIEKVEDQNKNFEVFTQNFEKYMKYLKSMQKLF